MLSVAQQTGIFAGNLFGDYFVSNLEKHSGDMFNKSGKILGSGNSAQKKSC